MTYQDDPDNHKRDHEDPVIWMHECKLCHDMVDRYIIAELSKES